ncbi:VWA domain-containing protein [Rhodococcus koreensis]|uniref:VWA domain-containing protein n=1 Tax=Rhodococcus koreensis TaxID=99653 RepID=UPI001F127792|nr:VWA domain-containing protein [Rhodococcus koreensis]
MSSSSPGAASSPHAGFFAVENVDTLSDAALYELLLSEYPDWLRAARQARVLG